MFATVVDAETLGIWRTRLISPLHPQFAYLQGAWTFEDGAGQVLTGIVPGTDGRLGSDGGADDADPTWIASGMVAVQAATWSGVKVLYR